jgi:hypothetical protein
MVSKGGAINKTTKDVTGGNFGGGIEERGIRKIVHDELRFKNGILCGRYYPIISLRLMKKFIG